MTDVEIKEMAILLQPELSKWLRERLGHLPFKDAMRVTAVLLGSGAGTATEILNRMMQGN